MKQCWIGLAAVTAAGCWYDFNTALNQCIRSGDCIAEAGSSDASAPADSGQGPDGGLLGDAGVLEGGVQDAGGGGDGGGGNSLSCLPPDGGFLPLAWLPQSVTGPLNAIWAASDTEAFAAGPGVLEHYAGQAWTSVSVPDPSGVTFNGVSGSGPADVWAVGSDSTPTGVVWHWDGGTWATVTPNWAAMGIGTLTLQDVWAQQAGSAVVVGNVPDGGVQLVTYQSGGWNTATGTLAAAAISQLSGGGGALWAAGASQTGAALLLRDAPPGVWATEIINATGTAFEAVWIASPSVGWVAGASSSAYTLNGLGQWSADTFLGMEDFNPHGLWGTGPHDAWAVSQFPLGRVAHWDGSGWSAYDLTTSPCGTNRWEQVTGGCHTLWLNFGGTVCMGQR